MVTEREKDIYNSYLYATRSAKGKPTRFRKDFSKLKDEDYVALKKLSAFFVKHNHVTIEIGLLLHSVCIIRMNGLILSFLTHVKLLSATLST